jgi:pimeloyl-ACP methyl ester carboxylesterase
MKKKLSSILLLLVLGNVYGQKLDSIAYDYGHLFYHSYGSGETIIMLAGGPGNNALQLESVAVKLAQKNRVVLLEQRGTGRSIPTKFDEETINIKTALSDINLLLDHLNLKSALFLGHSYGAELAVIYASQFPERVKSTILISPGNSDSNSAFVTLCNMSARLGREENERWETLYNKAWKVDLSEAEKNEYQYLNRLAYVYDKAKFDELFPLIDGQLNQKTFHYLSGELINQEFDILIPAQKINSPVYIISGRQDIYAFVAYELKIANPNIQLHWIDQSGHFPMYEQPEDFYNTLNQILEKI